MSRLSNKTGSISFLIFVMTLIVTFSIFVENASASHKYIGVNFEKLRITKTPVESHSNMALTEITISYEIRREDWEQLCDYGIKPKIKIRNRHGEKLIKTSIDERRGKLRFRTRVEVGRYLEVRISGKHRGVKIDENGYRRQCDRWISVKVKKAYQAHNQGWIKSILRSCEVRSVGKRKCMQLAKSIGFKPSAKIFKACSTRTKWASTFTRCVKAASRIKRGSAKIIVACSEASKGWSSNLLYCLEDARTVRAEPVSLIRSCNNASKWFSDFRKCIKDSKDLVDAPRVVAACDSATKWPSDLHQCLKSAKGLDDPASIVEICAETTDWPSELKACVKEGGPFAERKKTYRRERRYYSYRQF